VVLQPTEDTLEFSAKFRSEDANQPIGVRLFIDYGFEATDGNPYAEVKPGAKVGPGSLDDVEPRVATAKWSPSALFTGCHTVTLMLSHSFEDLTGCPTDLEDSSYLTWNVYVCKQNEPCVPQIDLDCVPQGKPLNCAANAMAAP
jgi:hypothetical protein